MSKKRAQLTMVLMAALLAVLLFTAFRGWDKAGTGSVKNIKLGLDLSGASAIIRDAQLSVSTTTRQKHRFIRKETTGSISRFRVYRMRTRSLQSWANPVPWSSSWRTEQWFLTVLM